jgi:hypothetical protein
LGDSNDYNIDDGDDAAPSIRKGRKGGKIAILKAKSGSGERNEVEMTKEVFLADIAACVGYSKNTTAS